MDAITDSEGEYPLWVDPEWWESGNKRPRPPKDEEL